VPPGHGDAGNARTLIASGQPEPEWLDFDEGSYWSHAARAYRDLGHARDAERCARKAVGLCLAAHPELRVIRMRYQHEHPLNHLIWQARHFLPPLSITSAAAPPGRYRAAGLLRSSVSPAGITYPADHALDGFGISVAAMNLRPGLAHGAGTSNTGLACGSLGGAVVMARGLGSGRCKGFCQVSEQPGCSHLTRSIVAASGLAKCVDIGWMPRVSVPTAMRLAWRALFLHDIERAVRRNWGADTCPPADRRAGPRITRSAKPGRPQLRGPSLALRSFRPPALPTLDPRHSRHRGTARRRTAEALDPASAD
jgi:hypothetical protein